MSKHMTVITDKVAGEEIYKQLGAGKDPQLKSVWILRQKNGADWLGLIGDMVSNQDPRSVREQLDTNYAHGGGWHPLKEWTMLPSDRIKYPGDPPLSPMIETMIRDEKVLIYEYSWVAIVQKDGSFEVARMD